jgi:glycosyltransferase involved in cell wall biosynthesis
MFAGTMGQAQKLDVVLDAAEQLRDLPQVQFVLVGYGNDCERLKETARQRGLPNVIFPGRFPASEMSDLYAMADVLLIHLIDDPLFRITIPHKVFTYMAAGKPILAAITGDTAQVINDAQAGISCQPSDPGAIAAAVRKIYAMSAEERRVWGSNGRRVACEFFNRDYLTGKVAAMLEDVLAKRGGGSSSASAPKSQEDVSK